MENLTNKELMTLKEKIDAEVRRREKMEEIELVAKLDKIIKRLNEIGTVKTYSRNELITGAEIGTYGDVYLIRER